MKLREFEVATSLCENGLERDPSNDDLKKIHKVPTNTFQLHVELSD